MHPRRDRTLVPSLFRYLLVVVAGMGYLVAAIGFPLPVRSAAASGSFSCAWRACGCSSEEQCLRACCCSRDQVPVVEPEPACSTCCEQSQPSKPPAITWVIGLQEQQCRGLATLWLATATSLPPPSRVSLELDRPLAGRIVHLVCHPTAAQSLPAIPPPRAC